MEIVLGKLNGVFLQNLLGQSSAKCRLIRAAVAYAQASNPLFEHCKRSRDVRLIFYGLLDEDGAVAPNLLRSFLDQGPSRVDCRLVRGSFHPKVVWWEGYGAYIGSANLTQAAWSKNVECGVFYTERELRSLEIDVELRTMFEYLGKHSVALTAELVAKLDALAADRQGLVDAQRKFKSKFDAIMLGVPEHAGVTAVPAKGAKSNVTQQTFIREWTDTLQKLRGLSTEFIGLNKRPNWVAKDAHQAVHFDQFLHAYYYEYVRGGLDEDDDGEDDDTEPVERSFERHQSNPSAALQDAARWWAKLPEAPYGEAEFIESIGPSMTTLFSKAAIAEMNANTFREAIGNVNAFRMHARQMRNDFFGLPAGHKEDIERRVDRFAQWLWSSPDARTTTGKDVRDVLDFVIWGTSPGDMEERLWLATHDPAWSIQHFGKSTLGEAVGWARPDEFPPRNNRTNKALRALGHDVGLF